MKYNQNMEDNVSMKVEEPALCDYSRTSRQRHYDSTHSLRTDRARAITGAELMDRLRPRLKSLFK